MRLGKRPASLRITLNNSSSSSADTVAISAGISSSPQPAESSPRQHSRAPLDAEYLLHAKRVKQCAPAAGLSNFQTTGCLSPTNSPQLLDQSLRLAAAVKEKSDSQIGPYILLSPLDSAGVSYHALHTKTRKISTCQVLSESQRNHFYGISERLNAVRAQDWPHGDIEEMRELVIPAGTEIIQKQGTSYLFLPGNFGSLHSFVQNQKRLDEETGRGIYAQIVRLVAFSHSIGIVVRDLKLRKFVFTDRNRSKLRLSSVNDLVVLSRWGEDALTDRHGCPAYVSPEILNLQQKAYSGKAADIWSLGVLLFVMLLGRYPFYDSTPAGLFGKIRQGVFSIPSDFGLSLEARFLLRGLLRRDPAQRPSAATLMAIPWLEHTSDFTTPPLASPPLRNLSSGSTIDDHVVPSIS